MSKLVVLKLDGDLEQGFRITLEIGQEGQYPDIATSGSLPPNPELAAQLAQWQTHYHRLSAPYRALRPRQIRYDGSLHPIAACLQSAKTLEKQLRLWLQSDSFREVDSQLRQALVQEEPIRILLRTDNQQLHQLPWHVWDIVEQYPKAEVALGAPKFRRSFAQPARSAAATDGVRILAILGDRSNINVESDQQMLRELPGANLTFLIEPSRRVLHDHLCERPWDILFFAGHSETTKDGEGRIKLNSDVSLTIEELKYGVNRAIAHGLQLAIFNSCDGLGLAHALEELQLPQMIVMRQPIPDPVAQEFLKYFLKAFARGESFYLAEREARERLQSLEDQFPCASWLPIIYQHPAAIPVTWQQLCGNEPEENVPVKTQNSKLKTPLFTSLRQQLGLVCLSSVAVTALVMGLRWFGWLQSWELQSYDRLLRQRPAELPDSRILLVGADERDLQQYGFPLPDAVLAQVIEKLEHYRPAAVGIDIYRDRPIPPDDELFVAALRNHTNIIAVCTFGTNEMQAIAPPPDSPAEQIGFADLELDAVDTVVRRQVLSRSPNPISPLSPCTTPYSFSLQLVFNYLDRQIPAIPPTLTAEQDWQFDTTIIRRLTPRTGGYQNLDTRGNQILINYRATDEIAQQISIAALLQDQIDPNWIRDRVVLVGVTAASVQDDQATPYGRMRGLYIHAHVVSQLLDMILGNSLKGETTSDRPLIQGLPQWSDGLWVLGWSLVGGVLVWLPRSHLVNNIPFSLLTIGFGVAVVVLYGACWFALVRGLWLPLVPSVLALGITGGVMLVLTPKFAGSVRRSP